MLQSINLCPIIPIILAGGSGSRLWPLSNKQTPKQFLNFRDNHLLLIEETLLRAAKLEGVENIIIVTQQSYFAQTYKIIQRFSCHIQKQLHILVEPFGRNTFGALGLALHYINTKIYANCDVLMMPVDHDIKPFEAFAQDLRSAGEIQNKDKIIVFGVIPEFPCVGYGYIINNNQNTQFIEKPNMDRAIQLMESGAFWNSGIIYAHFRVILNEYNVVKQDLTKTFVSCIKNCLLEQDKNVLIAHVKEKDYENIENLSIDRGLLEKSLKLLMLPAHFSWFDVGTWNQFSMDYKMDAYKNKIHGNVSAKNTHNCIIHSELHQIVAVGVKNLIIAESNNSILVANRDFPEDIRWAEEEYQENIPPQSNSSNVPGGGPDYKFFTIDIQPGEHIYVKADQDYTGHMIVLVGIIDLLQDKNKKTLKQNDYFYVVTENTQILANSYQQTTKLLFVKYG